jgi:hypothetical protein
MYMDVEKCRSGGTGTGACSTSRVSTSAPFTDCSHIWSLDSINSGVCLRASIEQFASDPVPTI